MNGIFVYLLYRSVQLSEVGRLTVALGCVYTSCTKLEGPVAPYTPGVRPLDHSRMFTRPWQKIWRERHFRTPVVRICTPPSNRSLTVPVDSVYRSCTKVGGLAAPCTPGVRLLDRSSMFNRSWRTICRERHFRTPTVRICTALRSRTPYSCIRLCVHKLYQTGRSRCSLYTRCTTIRPLKYVHYAVANKLQRTAFMYTLCTYLYGCLQ